MRNPLERAKRLLALFEKIDDSFLDEAELTDLASKIVSRKRLVQYGALGAGAMVSLGGVAAVCLFLRSKRASAGIGNAEEVGA